MQIYLSLPVRLVLPTGLQTGPRPHAKLMQVADGLAGGSAWAAAIWQLWLKHTNMLQQPGKSLIGRAGRGRHERSVPS